MTTRGTTAACTLLLVLSLFPLGRTVGQDLKVRVSFKIILDEEGKRPATGTVSQDEQIVAAVAAANGILEFNQARWRLALTEIVELAGVSEWNGRESKNLRSGIEQPALAEPQRYAWRFDAVNVFINQHGCGGNAASFPTRGSSRFTIAMDTRDTECFPDIFPPFDFDPEYEAGQTIIHEIGHFFDLTHTHGADYVCLDAAGEKMGREPVGDDGLSDTLPDLDCWSRDSIANWSFESDYAVLSRDLQAQVDRTYFNIMSYHLPAMSSRNEQVFLTEEQLAVAAGEMAPPESTRRGHVVYRDCDRNSVPDQEDFPPCADCNGNLVPDGEDIAAAPSLDCDGDGTIDACSLRGRPPVFKSPEVFLLADRVTALVAADFDGDTHPDVATVSSSSGGVVVLWNDGAASFTTADPIDQIGDSPSAIAAGDFDADAELDLVVVNRESEDIAILRNLGDRTFAPPVKVPLGFPPSRRSPLVAADLDGDARADLTLIDDVANRVTVLFHSEAPGDGMKTFRSVPLGATDGNPQRLQVVDFDAQGGLDIAAVDNSARSVVIFLNDGEGAFGKPLTIPLGSSSLSLVLADLNRDGNQDLATLEGLNEIATRFAEEDGRFSEAELSVRWNGVAQSQQQPLFAADLNQDGAPELLTVSTTPPGVVVLRNRRDATFATGTLLPTGLSAALAVEDFDSDGRPDLVLATASGVTVFRNETLPPPASDCNRNNVPDACELATGELADENKNGFPDACERIRRFIRGDCDQDGSACNGVNDALDLLSWLFLGRAAPPCRAACDADGNGELELADAVYGLNFCFDGRAAPVAPFPACGPGTDADMGLGCAASICE